MVIRSAFAGVALAAFALPSLAQPAPPVPPAPPPAPALAPAPPVPPRPPEPPELPRDFAFVHGGGSEVISRNVNGRRVTIIARRPGGETRWNSDGTREVLSYKDAEGRDVKVYSNSAVTRDEAEKLRAEARVEGERARAEGAKAREAGRLAREEGRRAREQAWEARRRALDDAHRAVAEARAGRDFANLSRRELRIFRHDGKDGPQVWIDGAPMRDLGPGFAGGPEMRQLREELKALREEMKSLRAELDRERARR